MVNFLSLTDEDVFLAFAELSNEVMRLDIHPDDKLALRGMIEMRKIAELTRMRKDEDNQCKLRAILRNN